MFGGARGDASDVVDWGQCSSTRVWFCYFVSMLLLLGDDDFGTRPILS